MLGARNGTEEQQQPGTLQIRELSQQPALFLQASVGAGPDELVVASGHAQCNEPTLCWWLLAATNIFSELAYA